ncbi:MAG: hypothetical protein FWF83_07220, partial [Clostridiales bacterium]|nr:hypothetical protein [Clostridiales bacterium]
MAEGTNTRDIRRSRSRSQRLTRLTLILVGLVLLAGSLYSLCMYALSNMAGLGAGQFVSWGQTGSRPAWAFPREHG